jgi:hypothetical protein
MVFTFDILEESKEVEVVFDLFYGAQAANDQQIMHKSIKGSDSHLDFTADTDGFYSYCLQLPPQGEEPTPVRLKMMLHYGFDSDYYEKLAKKNDYDAINLQVHRLNDMLTLTLNEADYQKHKETEYHETTEEMNNAALWWPVLQVGPSCLPTFPCCFTVLYSTINRSFYLFFFLSLCRLEY